MEEEILQKAIRAAKIAPRIEPAIVIPAGERRKQLIELSLAYERMRERLEDPPLRDKFADEGPPLATIFRVVASFYHLTKIEFFSDRHHPSVVKPRQVAMYLAKKLTKHSFPAIGRLLNRDHTTVLTGANRIADQILIDDVMRRQIDELKSQIAAECALVPEPMPELVPAEVTAS